jgi:hypothetical protein
MTRKEILARWLSLEHADGVSRARRMRRKLSVASFVVFAVAFATGIYFKLHPSITLVLGAVVGWLIAESNALQSRLNLFPVYREYIDWEKVERDSRDPTSG